MWYVCIVPRRGVFPVHCCAVCYVPQWCVDDTAAQYPPLHSMSIAVEQSSPAWLKRPFHGRSSRGVCACLLVCNQGVCVSRDASRRKCRIGRGGTGRTRELEYVQKVRGICLAAARLRNRWQKQKPALFVPQAVPCFACFSFSPFWLDHFCTFASYSLNVRTFVGCIGLAKQQPRLIDCRKVSNSIHYRKAPSKVVIPSVYLIVIFR